MPFPQLTPPDRRVAAGVCGGIGDAIGVDPTLVRLVFALLALAGGAGIVLYVAAWFAMSGRRREKPWAPLLLVVIAASLALGALGLSGPAVASLALVAGGLALIWRRGGSLRPRAPPSAAASCWSRGRGSGSSASSATPSALRASGRRSARRSPRACTTRSCRRWR